MLRITGNVIRKAKRLHNRRILSNTGFDISNTIASLMLSKYLESDWDLILRDGLVLIKNTNNEFEITSPVPGCYETSEGVSAPCPSVTLFNSSLGDKVGYFVKVEKNYRIYQVTVTVGCKPTITCNTADYSKVKVTRYLVK